jgi:hypothetical protein
MLHAMQAPALRIALGAVLVTRIVLMFGRLHVLGMFLGTVLFISVCGPCVRGQQA